MEPNTAQMLARIEKLESMVLRRGGGGVPGSTQSFAGPIVANQAAAIALPAVILPNGEQVLTLAQMAIWQKIDGVPGTVGVPPLAANEVIATTDGTGVLARTSYSSPKWRVGVNDIYIDPANGAASDENDGLTALTPLATGMELFRRWGWGTPVVIGPNLATSPDGFINVNIVSNIVTPDQLEMSVVMIPNASLRFRGGTPTTIRTSTLTGASTPMDPNAPLGGTRLRLVDAATATWVPDMVANRRGRITTGAQAGATFQPQTNVGVGGAVDCSAAQTTNEAGFSQSPTTVTPAAGSTYVIESLVQCNFGMIEVRQQQNPDFGGFNTFVNFTNLNFPAIGANGISWAPVSPGGSFSQPFFNFYQCTFDRIVDITQCPGAQFVASYFFNAGLINFGTGGTQSLNGGGANSVAPGTMQIIWGVYSNTSTVDFNFVANRSLFFFLGSTNGKLFASWNALALAGINTAGHGVVIGVNGFSGQSGNVRFSSQVWGGGNGGSGLLVGAGCKGAGSAKNITGVQGDVKLAQSLVGWWWNAAGAVYNPVGAGIVTSWANIAAAKGAAGFGGSAHEPDQDAHWLLPETTA